MKIKFFCIILYSGMIISMMNSSISYAQGDGYGGVQSPFIHGVGARALSLGNAYVAMPFDASAIYWNPAGLDHVQYKNVMLFHSNLIVPGINLYYLGYVHPTTSFGALGVGVMGIGVDGIGIRDQQAVYYGDKTYSDQQYFISYGKQLPWNLSAGINLKVHYQNITGFTTSGVGTDLGILYKPNFTHPLLSGLCVGMSIQNLVGPRLKAGTGETDILPVNMRLGLAKPILVNEWGPQVTFFLDLEKSEEGVPFKFHTGTEYVFRNMAMLRVGLNNSELAFGAGAVFRNFQLDYSYGKFAENELSPSHRISFSINIGKSKSELIQIAEDRRMQDIRTGVAEGLRFEREQKIDNAMDFGRQFLAADAFARAIREFNFVMGFENELPEDPRIEEAKRLAAEASDRSNNEVEQRAKEDQAQTEREKLKNQKQARSNQQFELGMVHYEAEEYDKAIEQWQRMLEEDPENSLAKEHIKNAEAELEKKLLRYIIQADAYAKNDNYHDAIMELNKARRLNTQDNKQIVLIDQKETKYSNRLTFDELYGEGYGYYLQKDYSRAMESLRKALGYDSNNEEVKNLFFAAQQRANAKKEPLTGAVKQKFGQMKEMYSKGRYQEAMTILKEIEKEKPFNKHILDYIDYTQQKIEQQKRRPNQQ
jgi:tetratricopeptide (TPR) repeat protein